MCNSDIFLQHRRWFPSAFTLFNTQRARKQQKTVRSGRPSVRPFVHPFVHIEPTLNTTCTPNISPSYVRGL